MNTGIAIDGSQYNISPVSFFVNICSLINLNAMSASHITFRKSVTQTFGKLINLKFIQVIIAERVRSGRKKNTHTNKYPALFQAVLLGLA